MKRQIYIKENKRDYSIKQGYIHSAKKENLKDVRVGNLLTLINENLDKEKRMW